MLGSRKSSNPLIKKQKIVINLLCRKGIGQQVDNKLCTI